MMRKRGMEPDDKGLDVQGLYSSNQHDYSKSGGFSAEDAVSSAPKRKAVVLTSEERDLPCVECGLEIADSYLYRSFKFQLCNCCRDMKRNEPEYQMINRTTAKQEYLLKDEDFDYRKPPLMCISKKNPHNPRYGDMKLYLVAQVKERAISIHGSMEEIEELKRHRSMKREVMAEKRFEKKIKKMREELRSSESKSLDLKPKWHSHEFEEGKPIEGQKFYTKKCKTCDFEATFEREDSLPNDVISILTAAQIVTTLDSACRELLDNAIDAGATSIEIKLKEKGSELIEVVDNGKGIAEADFSMVAQAHCTSKLRCVGDFDNLQTYGFRGQALNSLAKFSSLSIVTRATDAKCGSKLTFDEDGKLVDVKKIARNTGTTICVQNIFERLPVRRKEMIDQIEHHFLNMLHSIQAYALCWPNIEIKCRSVKPLRSKCFIATTGGQAQLKDVISLIFGHSGFIEIDNVIPTMETRKLYSAEKMPEKMFSEVFKIHGYVSTITSSSTVANNLFIFVNRRHIDYPKAHKIINTLYRTKRKDRYPILVLFLETHPSRINVCITPDKRTINLRDENVFLAKLHEALVKAFELEESTFIPLSTNNVKDGVPFRVSSSQSKGENRSLKRKAIENVEDENDPKSSPAIRNKRSSTRKSTMGDGSDSFSIEKSPAPPANSMFPSLWTLPVANNSSASNNFQERPNDESNQQIDLHVSESAVDTHQDNFIEEPFIGNEQTNNSFGFWNDDGFNNSLRDDSLQANQPSTIGYGMSLLDQSWRDTNYAAEIGMDRREFLTEDEILNELFEAEADVEILDDFEGDDEFFQTNSSKFNKQNLKLFSQLCFNGIFAQPLQTYQIKCPEKVFTNFKMQKGQNSSETNFNLDYFEEFNDPEIDQLVDAIKEHDESFGFCISHLEKHNNENDNFDGKEVASENETRVLLKKKEFGSMIVHWQFNKSFIFCSLGSNIFIVDQHAANEKFNYEKLWKTTKMKIQPLVCPMKMNLSPIQKQILLSNLASFHNSGFRAQIFDDSNEVYISTVPVYGAQTFGLPEFEEALAYFAEHPNRNIYRPQKLHAIYASKACRSSIMVGDDLDLKKMAMHVHRLATLDHPWNCPHGRPTIRLFQMGINTPFAFSCKL
uniref:Uncharacterized protein n=1 Tax=Panagrolaimus sp. JU765 TaxID=591449 RepID=A0AC34Q681_9BILA